jgi:hypothetical protein
VPQGEAESWSTTGVDGWYGDILAAAQIVYSKDDKRFLYVPAKNGDGLPDDVAMSSETLGARQAIAAKKRQNELIKSVELDEQAFKHMTQHCKRLFPHKDTQLCYPALKLCCSRHEGEQELSTARIIAGCEMTESNPLPNRLNDHCHSEESKTWCNGKQPCKEIVTRRTQISTAVRAMQMQKYTGLLGVQATAIELKEPTAQPSRPQQSVWGKQSLSEVERARALETSDNNEKTTEEREPVRAPDGKDKIAFYSTGTKVLFTHARTKEVTEGEIASVGLDDPPHVYYSVKYLKGDGEWSEIQVNASTIRLSPVSATQPPNEAHIQAEAGSSEGTPVDLETGSTPKRNEKPNSAPNSGAGMKRGVITTEDSCSSPIKKKPTQQPESKSSKNHRNANFEIPHESETREEQNLPTLHDYEAAQGGGDGQSKSMRTDTHCSATPNKTDTTAPASPTVTPPTKSSPQNTTNPMSTPCQPQANPCQPMPTHANHTHTQPHYTTPHTITHHHTTPVEAEAWDWDWPLYLPFDACDTPHHTNSTHLNTHPLPLTTTPLTTTHYRSLRLTTTHHNSLPLTTTHYHSLPLTTTRYISLPLTTTHYHSLQLTTTHNHSLRLATAPYHSLLLTTTHYHSLPLATTHHHPLPLTTTHYHLPPLTTTRYHSLPLITTHYHSPSLTTTRYYSLPLSTAQ